MMRFKNVTIVSLLSLIVFLFIIIGHSHAITHKTTEAYQGWGSDTTFDFTQTQTVNGTDYFGWDELTIDAKFENEKYVFDITMPKELSGGDNFDFIFDHDYNGTDSADDILVHYANNGPVNYWIDEWDSKIYDGDSWTHQYGLPSDVSASKIGDKNYQLTFDAGLATGDAIKFAFMSPLGGVPPSYGWMGEAAIISNWSDGEYVDVSGVGAPVPEPTTMLLFGTGLLGLVGLGRKKLFGKKQ